MRARRSASTAEDSTDGVRIGGHERPSDRDALRGGAQVPAAARVRGAGERAAGDLRHPVRGVLGAGGRERVTWFEPFTSLLEWELPYAKWYGGGKINVAYNCLDRHVEAGLGDRGRLLLRGRAGRRASRDHVRQLLDEVVRAANGLKALGVGKGTPVGIYMGMGPGLPVAMLACARLGAPHTVVFGGFSAEALADRLNDMRCEVLLTQDESYRRGTIVPLKRNADEALESCPGVRTVVVGQRTAATCR